MRKTILALVSIGLLSVTGCASSLKLENVAGTWSCDRVDGVCADIADIDVRTIGPRLEGQPVGSPDAVPPGRQGDMISVSTSTETVMPSRTADEVARIVLAPSLDAQGRYHSARVMFAVMKPGDWVPGSVPVNMPTSTRTAATQSPDPGTITKTSGAAVAKQAARVSAEEATRTVTRTVSRTIVPAPTRAPRPENASSDQKQTQIADVSNAQ